MRRESWKTKAFYADAAKDGAVKIDRAIKNRLSSSVLNEQGGIIIWNDSAHKVSGSTEIYLGRDAFRLKELRDQNGNKAVFQEIASNRYLIMAEDVPPFGAKALYPVFSKSPDDFVFNSMEMPDNFENDYFEIKFDSTGNIVSIQDKLSETEMLDLDSKWNFCEFILQRIDDLPLNGKFAGMKVNKDSYYPKSEITENVLTEGGPITIAVTQKGKITTDSRIIRYQRTLRFYHNSPRIDVKIRLDKPETEKKESCYMAFPFAGTDGSFKFDQNIGLVDPGEDLLPGAMLDLFYCSRFCALNAGNFSATIVTPDAPLVQFGGIQTAQWLQEFPFKPKANHIYGQIYHNLLNTDCPIWQDVLESFEYSIWFHSGEFDYSSAQIDCNSTTALSASFSNANTLADSTLKSLQISPQSIRLLAIRKLKNTCQLILENPSHETIAAKIKYNNKSQSLLIDAFDIENMSISLSC